MWGCFVQQIIKFWIKPVWLGYSCYVTYTCYNVFNIHHVVPYTNVYNKVAGFKKFGRHVSAIGVLFLGAVCTLYRSELKRGTSLFVPNRRRICPVSVFFDYYNSVLFSVTDPRTSPEYYRVPIPVQAVVTSCLPHASSLSGRGGRQKNRPRWRNRYDGVLIFDDFESGWLFVVVVGCSLNHSNHFVSVAVRYRGGSVADLAICRQQSNQK